MAPSLHQLGVYRLHLLADQHNVQGQFNDPLYQLSTTAVVVPSKTLPVVRCGSVVSSPSPHPQWSLLYIPGSLECLY